MNGLQTAQHSTAQHSTLCLQGLCVVCCALGPGNAGMPSGPVGYSQYLLIATAAIVVYALNMVTG
jgi:hypothetical protein